MPRGRRRGRARPSRSPPQSPSTLRTVSNDTDADSKPPQSPKGGRAEQEEELSDLRAPIPPEIVVVPPVLSEDVQVEQVTTSAKEGLSNSEEQARSKTFEATSHAPFCLRTSPDELDEARSGQPYHQDLLRHSNVNHAMAAEAGQTETRGGSCLTQVQHVSPRLTHPRQAIHLCQGTR